MAMASHQMMIQLLQGPTRLAVGALGGVAASDALLGSRALCYVERIPYDDEAFRSMHSTAAEKALASYKPRRPVGTAAAARLISPSHLAITLGRNVGLTVLVVINRWLVAALEEEELAEAQGHEPQMPPLRIEDVGMACVRGAYNAGVELLTQGTRAALDARALLKLPPRLAKKLIKDLRLSAARKAPLVWYSRSLRVARTALFSEVTWWTADFLVSCAIEMYAAATKGVGNVQKRVQRLLLRCGLHAARAGLALAAVSAGYGLGAAAPRGRGLFMWALSMVATFFVNSSMTSFMNRLAPLAPPAGGAGAGAAAGGADEGAAAGEGGAPLPAAAPHGGFVMIGQQVHPAAVAAMAAGGGAAAAGEQMGDDIVANGEVEGAVAGAEGAAEPGVVAPQEAAAAAEAEAGADVPEVPQQQQPPQQHDAGVQAGAPGADEPPIPAPQQRRVVGGPRLPDRPPRRNMGAGPGPEDNDAEDPEAPGVPVLLAPPPAAPHTPQFRDQRAPTPSGDSEEAEARALAAAASVGVSPSGSAPGGSSNDSEVPAAASPADGSGSSGAGAAATAAAARFAAQQGAPVSMGGRTLVRHRSG